MKPVNDHYGSWQKCWLCNRSPEHYTIDFWGHYIHYCNIHQPPMDLDIKPNIYQHTFDVGIWADNYLEHYSGC